MFDWHYHKRKGKIIRTTKKYAIIEFSAGGRKRITRRPLENIKSWDSLRFEENNCVYESKSVLTSKEDGQSQGTHGSSE
jgi:hypothetical protein